MNTPALILDFIPKIQAYLQTQPVSKAWLFGSYARGEANEESDVDILVEFIEGATLFDQARMTWQLEDLLTKKVDVISARGLSKHIGPFIERDCYLIYGE